MNREEELDWLYRLRSEIYVYMPKEWLIPMNNALDTAIKALENQKTGHWIFKNDNIAIPTGYYQCSECEIGTLLNKDNFCPNCGAKMKGESNE